MMKIAICRACLLLCAAAMTTGAQAVGHEPADSVARIVPEQWAVDPQEWVDTALLHQANQPADPYASLTADDYRHVADELGIEVAAIKAVVDIEAGPTAKGFWAPGKPVINFDLSMFRKFAPRNGLSIATAKKKAPVIFARPNIRKYGSQQAGQQARLDAACELNPAAGIEGTFWGMFQIGGFNWKKLGFESPEAFAAEMSRSERAQLEIFARFISVFNMVDDIRNHRWLKFALKYNGPRAKSRGYHTRMAAAYARHKKETAGATEK